jgi:hypothetical protein
VCDGWDDDAEFEAWLSEAVDRTNPYDANGGGGMTGGPGWQAPSTTPADTPGVYADATIATLRMGHAAELACFRASGTLPALAAVDLTGVRTLAKGGIAAWRAMKRGIKGATRSAVIETAHGQAVGVAVALPVQVAGGSVARRIGEFALGYLPGPSTKGAWDTMLQKCWNP